MKLSDRAYNNLKWIVWTFMPSLITLISGLGELYAWENAGTIVTLLGLLTVFLGAVTGVSNYNYNKEGAEDDTSN